MVRSAEPKKQILENWRSTNANEFPVLPDHKKTAAYWFQC